MKKLSGLIFLISFFSFNCHPKQGSPTDMVNIPATAEDGVDKSNLPEMKFEEEVFDFGTITQGEKVTHDFRFTNTGEKELVIANAYADCGCTVPLVPKMPVPSGKGDVVRVSFDSKDRSGMVTKTITILTNCIPNKRVIQIKANIFVPQTKQPS